MQIKNILFGKFISKNLVEKSSFNILDNMTNDKDLLAKELLVLYPDFTDDELKEATKNLRYFYTQAVKVALKNQENKQNTNVDNKNHSNRPH